jgi:uncharacterized repeat protein (TIGR03803 family)
MIYGYKQLARPEDWKEIVGTGKWRPMRSDYELAYKWHGVRSMPARVRDVFKSSIVRIFQSLRVACLYVERPTFLDTFRAPSCTDIVAYCRSRDDRMVIVGVEGKAAEPFGKPVCEWITGSGTSEKATGSPSKRFSDTLALSLHQKVRLPVHVFLVRTKRSRRTLFGFQMNLSNQTAVDSAISQSVLAHAICISSAAIFLFFATCAQSDDLTTLYSFDGTNGSNPHYGLVKGADGNFYGTARLGGTNSSSGIFRITASGALTWVHKFTGGTNGDGPNRLLLGTDGNFYGTTYAGGTTNYNSFGSYGYGTVFRMTASGTLTTLYSFKADSVGCYPSAGLVQAKDGSFYGVTQKAGIQPGSYNGFGTVFKITTDGKTSPVYSFPNSELGYPSAELVEGSDGDLYGTAYGVFRGAVFKLSTNGTLRWAKFFSGDCQINCGSRPNAGLVSAADGSSFYGTTSSGGSPDSTLRGYGTVFKITTNGILSTLFLFNNNFNGARPSSTLVRMTYSKIFFGMTESTIFRLIGTNVTLEWVHLERALQARCCRVEKALFMGQPTTVALMVKEPYSGSVLRHLRCLRLPGLYRRR